MSFLQSATLMSTYFHNMDVKGRMSFPNKLRELVGEKFIVTKGLDKCLFVYSLEAWDEFVDNLSDVPISKGGKELTRFFISSAIEVEADKQGRILISQALREYAGLEKDVVVTGSLKRCEIWDEAIWREYNDELVGDKINSAVENLDFAF